MVLTLIGWQILRVYMKAPPRDRGPDSSAAATCRSRTFLELGVFLGPAGRVSGTVGMRAGTRELAFVDDQILVADRPALEIAFQDFARAGRVARLRGK